MAAMDVVEADVLDPHADIYALFCYYDSLYFDESLGACSVSWSSSRMTRCAGVCRYLPGGGCEIHLSEPLLKFRSTADVKNTLLHEMIHAFLWIKHNNKDHSQHGPGFQALMNKINSSSLIDHQKPAGGYNITIYHQFHNEVDSYRVHHWICDGCGDMIKRAINRQPSAGDCMERFRENGSCGNTSCHWHNHKMVCSGSYKKIAEPSGYKGKRKRAKEPVDDKPEGRGDMINKRTRKSHSKAESKAQYSLENMKSPTRFFPSASNQSNCLTDTSLPEGSKIEALNAVEPKKQTLTLVPQFPKRPRTAHAQNSRYACNKRRKVDKEKDRCIVFSKWLGYFADEQSDEEVEPLINKRTERRKKLKLLENQKAKLSESQASDATQTANSSTSILRRNQGELMGSYLLCHRNENGGPVGC